MTVLDPAPLPDWLTTRGADPDLVRREYLEVIAEAIDAHPRSLQVAIGPSEIGVPCARRIGYKLANRPELNHGAPAWLPTIGTAVHTWLEEAFVAHDAKHYGPEMSRWVTEQTVTVGEALGQAITGHCDLFDQATGTVIDHKIIGPTQLKKYRSKGPGNQYRTQAHLYGRGWASKGYHVETVMVAFLPRSGPLSDAYFWHEPYDEQIALDALRRLEGIGLTLQALGDAAFAALPTADNYCHFCPYFRDASDDPANGCPGDPASKASARVDPDAPAFGAL